MGIPSLERPPGGGAEGEAGCARASMSGYYDMASYYAADGGTIALSRHDVEAGVARLGELEHAVMDVVWARPGPVSVREVLDVLTPQRQLAYTTVMTIMDRLARKGVLARERDGRAYRYTPVASREAYTASLLADALAGAEDRAAVLVRFVEQMDTDEVDAVRRALARAARRGRR